MICTRAVRWCKPSARLSAPWLPIFNEYRCGTPATGWAKPMNVESFGSSVCGLPAAGAPLPPSYTAMRKPAVVVADRRGRVERNRDRPHRRHAARRLVARQILQEDGVVEPEVDGRVVDLGHVVELRPPGVVCRGVGRQVAGVAQAGGGGGRRRETAAGEGDRRGGGIAAPAGSDLHARHHAAREDGDPGGLRGRSAAAEGDRRWRRVSGCRRW